MWAQLFVHAALDGVNRNTVGTSPASAGSRELSARETYFLFVSEIYDSALSFLFAFQILSMA